MADWACDPGSAAALLAAGSVYGRETTELANAAIAQDLVTGLIVFPTILVATRLASRGSAFAHLVGVGAIAFLVYNYAIYCFSVSFGPLFLLWTGLLGLSTYALVTGLRESVQLDVVHKLRSTRLAAGTLIGVAVIFAALWLSEILPDLMHERGSTSAAEWQVPTNPVHVLDLAMFLPAALVAGLRLRSRNASALMVAPGMLTFFVLTSLPIIATPVVASVRSDSASWGAVGPVFLIATLSAAALFSMRTAQA